MAWNQCVGAGIGGEGMKSNVIHIGRPNSTGNYINGGNITVELDFAPKEFIVATTDYGGDGSAKTGYYPTFVASGSYIKIVSLNGTTLVINDTYIRAYGGNVYIAYR